MTRPPVDDPTRSFFEALALKELGKEAVDLSAGTRAALGVGAEPDALDALEASAAPGDEDPGHGDPTAAPATSPPAPEAAPVQLVGSVPVVDDEPSSPEPAEDNVAAGVTPAGAPGRATHGKLFSARRAHPLELFEILQSKYGEEWLSWEPTTLWWAIRRDFGAVGELTRNKILALRVAYKTLGPWSDWDVFEKCGLAWNDQVPVFGAWQPLPPSHVAFTVQVLAAIHPEAPWTHEVSAYQAMILDDNGFVWVPPEWFPGAQVLLDRNRETAAFRDEVARAWGKLAGRDLSRVEWRPDSALDIHIARLFVIATYLEHRAALHHAGSAAATGATASTHPPVP